MSRHRLLAELRVGTPPREVLGRRGLLPAHVVSVLAWSRARPATRVGTDVRAGPACAAGSHATRPDSAADSPSERRARIQCERAVAPGSRPLGGSACARSTRPDVFRRTGSGTSRASDFAPDAQPTSAGSSRLCHARRTFDHLREVNPDPAYGADREGSDVADRGSPAFANVCSSLERAAAPPPREMIGSWGLLSRGERTGKGDGHRRGSGRKSSRNRPAGRLFEEPFGRTINAQAVGFDGPQDVDVCRIRLPARSDSAARLGMATTRGARA